MITVIDVASYQKKMYVYCMQSKLHMMFRNFDGLAYENDLKVAKLFFLTPNGFKYSIGRVKYQNGLNIAYIFLLLEWSTFTRGDCYHKKMYTICNPSLHMMCGNFDCLASWKLFENGVSSIALEGSSIIRFSRMYVSSSSRKEIHLQEEIVLPMWWVKQMDYFISVSKLSTPCCQLGCIFPHLYHLIVHNPIVW